MGVNTPRIARIRLMAAAVEATTGTAETLDAADAAFIVLDPQFNEEIDVVERELPAALGTERSIQGARKATLSFSMYIVGNGATGTPLWASTFLPACDMAETSGSFAFTHGGATLTMSLYEDGIKRSLAGARGTFKITAKAGDPVKIDFTFTGKFTEEADASMLSPTFPTVLPPIWGGNAVTFGSFAPKLAEISIDAGNGVVMREDAADASGYLAAAITTRKSVGTCDPESVSGRNWRTQIDGSTEEAMSLVIGSVTHNIITITAARCQPFKKARGNRNELMTEQVDLQFNGSTPFAIVFT